MDRPHPRTARHRRRTRTRPTHGCARRASPDNGRTTDRIGEPENARLRPHVPSKDARHLYAHSLTAGYVYESHLRDELTRRLGVAWGPIVNGIADTEGIAKPVLRAFSTRREDIEHRMAALGTTSTRGAEIAALDTRAAKDHSLNYADLVDDWAHRAANLNVWRTTIDELADHQLRRSTAPGSPDEVRRIERHLLGPDGLTERASTFDRRDVVRALASAYPNGATVALRGRGVWWRRG